MPLTHDPAIDHNPVHILQQLIQYDTTNPPGNEGPCIAYIQQLLEEAEIPTTRLALDPARPNLIARLRGQGRAAPLLLYGHVDVVTTDKQSWTVPPFEGRIEDGDLWGRGALDMKGGIAMMLGAFLRAQRESLPLPGDVILAVTSDEETLGMYGAAYLVEQHPDLFESVTYGISEFGGFTLYVAGKRCYPISIAEKRACWLTVTVRGQGGHGATPVQGGATAKAAAFLQLLDRSHLPVHITTPAQLMFGSFADALGGIKGFILRQLLNPRFTNIVLKLLGEQQSRQFSPLLHNTVSATGLHGSDKVNVIPSEVTIELDGRLLPGYEPEDLVSELTALVGDRIEGISFVINKFQDGPANLDMGLFETLKCILNELDPDGIPVPMMNPGVTDARLFSHLGIQTYGFTPMQLPEGTRFTELIHGADERIPVAAIPFGTEAIYQLIKRFGNC